MDTAPVIDGGLSAALEHGQSCAVFASLTRTVDGRATDILGCQSALQKAGAHIQGVGAFNASVIFDAMPDDIVRIAQLPHMASMRLAGMTDYFCFACAHVKRRIAARLTRGHYEPQHQRRGDVSARHPKP